VDAAVARFGQLDDYYIFDEVTVYFANAKLKLIPVLPPIASFGGKSQDH